MQVKKAPGIPHYNKTYSSDILTFNKFKAGEWTIEASRALTEVRIALAVTRPQKADNLAKAEIESVEQQGRY